MRARFLVLGGVFCLLAGSAAGQVPGVSAPGLGAFRDTLDLALPQPFALRPFIQPGTERIFVGEAPLDTAAYRIDYRFGRLWIDPLPDTAAVAVAVYRTWGFTFREDYVRRRVSAEAPDDSARAVVEERIAGGSYDPFAGVQLQRSGSITRGILAGNNRDVAVESGLRLELAGEVAEGVRVQAVLTDENTPILPEGTTQRLNEFDRVFIEIEAPQGTAQLGDFDLAFRESEFARLARKLQGVTLFGALPDPGTRAVGGGHVAVAGAIARGLFRQQDLDVLDGVQGPYRLEGQNGERFIIVIPGSEAVYVNGVRQTRGQTNDYVIDYATGEVTFTARQLLAPDDRVTVEFQYSTNQFTRTLVGTEARADLWQRPDQSPRAHLGVTVLRESDSREFSEEFGLTVEDDSLIAASGDAPATRDGAVPVEYDPEAPFVHYVRRDTVLADGTMEPFFRALAGAPPPGETVFRVRFTRVGPGEGSYLRQGRSVNGILFEYVGPGRGEYLPIRLLPKPKQQQLLDLRGGFEPLRRLEIFGEVARSLNDVNRLSVQDSADDEGTAFVGGVRLKPLPVAVGGADLGTVAFEVRRRFTGDDFATFDRTRPVEFARRWNLEAARIGQGGGTVQQGDETIDEATLAWNVTPRTSVRAEAGRIDRADVFTGTRRALTAEASEPGWPRLRYHLEHILSDDRDDAIDGRWLRQQGAVAQPVAGGRLVPQVEFEQERRLQRVGGTDSLAATSLAFVEVRPGLRWQSEHVEVGGSVELREEDLWAGGALRDGSRAWTVRSSFRLQRGATLSSEGSIGYRARRFTEFFRVEQQQQNRESVVLSWDGRYSPLQRAVSVNWFYEALTERTPRLQEIYIRTGPELGEFVWEDANGDGAIQLDEFIPERTPDEGTYVRTFIPSDELLPIIGVQTRLTLQLDPARRWRRADASWKRWLAKVSTRTSLQVQEQSREDDLAQIYLLNLSRFRQPGTTLKGLLRVGQDVYLFRNEPRYGATVSFNQARHLNELAAGLETRFLNQWRLEGTYRFSDQWSSRLAAALEDHRTQSETFASRDYDIVGRSVEPEVAFSPSSTIQATLSLALSRKRDAVGDRAARLVKIPLTARYTLARRLGVTARAEAARVAVDGTARGLAQFELTDGRGPGTSYLWTVSGWYQISRLLRATYSYNGRAPADAPTLHTVRVQLSAVF